MNIKESIFYKSIGAFLLFAFLIKVMIPVGFMPNLDTSNKMSFVICSSFGEVKTVSIDLGSDDLPQDEAATEKCPFALYSSAKTLVSHVQTAVQSIIFFDVVYEYRQLSQNYVSNRYFPTRAPPSLNLIFKNI